MSEQEIIERIMSAHWDMAACRCWVCEAGRQLGFGPREKYLPHRNDNRRLFPVPNGCRAPDYRDEWQPQKATP